MCTPPMPLLLLRLHLRSHPLPVCGHRLLSALRSSSVPPFVLFRHRPILQLVLAPHKPPLDCQHRRLYFGVCDEFLGGVLLPFIAHSSTACPNAGLDQSCAGVAGSDTHTWHCPATCSVTFSHRAHMASYFIRHQ